MRYISTGENTKNTNNAHAIFLFTRAFAMRWLEKRKEREHAMTYGTVEADGAFVLVNLST